MFKRVLFFIKNILTKFRSIPQNDNNEQDIIKPESTEESPINNEEIEIPDNNPIPAEEETEAIEETTIPAEEEPDPIEETLIPAEEETDTIEETLISAEEETDPIEETLTSDDIECYEPEKIKILKQFIQRTDAHIFLTGKAGTGKTTFLRNLVNNTNKKMIVVAPTGVAAINAGGVTIHSFFQLPFGPIMPKTKADIEDGIDIQKFNRDNRVRDAR